MELPGSALYQKLLLLRAEKCGLTVSDERSLRDLQRKLEMEILEHADVVCCTCVGAGDKRVMNFRFQHVSGRSGGMYVCGEEWAGGRVWGGAGSGG